MWLMTQLKKVLTRILHGTTDTNIAFTDLQRLLIELGFEERVRGSHHIFTKDGIQEIINLQSKDAKAKPYQVKQVRAMILKYHLGGSDDD
jgi:predicted RNA binding protein YcfA (HicA-like mRNA interferase family)